MAFRRDVDFDPVAAKAEAITPVPGGTGVVTTAVLVRNVVDATVRQRADCIPFVDR